MIKNVQVYGILESVVRSGYPMKTSIDDFMPEVINAYSTNTNCWDRARNLGNTKIGSAHDQFLTGCIVQFDVTASIKWWTEAERYHFLDFISSQSTMHRITQFDISNQCNKYVSCETKTMLCEMIENYKANPTEENYMTVLYNVPVGFQLTAGMTTNYRQLKTIYNQRRHHTLEEWREFCVWIESLPHFKELCLGERKTL